MKWNFCPTCGHRIYKHRLAGCTHVETTRHIVQINETGWTLKHPLREREADKLFDCQVHRDLQGLSTFPGPGEYSIREFSNGGWSFEPAERGRTECDCDVSFDQLRQE